MSGCHPDKKAELCIHGTYITGHDCVACKLQFQITALNTRIEALHEFKLRQCNENKENKKRIDNFYNAHGLSDMINNESNQKLEKRIEEIESSHNGLTQSIFHRLKKIEDKFAYFMQNYPLNEKKPHQCPVCDGNGGVPHPLTGLLAPATCCSCKGQGIVWG